MMLISSKSIVSLFILVVVSLLILGCKSSGEGIHLQPELQSNTQPLTKKEHELEYIQRKIAAAYNRLNEIEEKTHQKQSQLETLERLTHQNSTRLNLQNVALERSKIRLQRKEQELLACNKQCEETQEQLNMQQINLQCQQSLDNNTAQMQLKAMQDQFLQQTQQLFQLSDLSNARSQEVLQMMNLAEDFVTTTSLYDSDLRSKIVDELKIFYEVIQQNHELQNDNIELIGEISLKSDSSDCESMTQYDLMDEEEPPANRQIQMQDAQVQTQTNDYIFALNKKLNKLASTHNVCIQKKQKMSDENEELKQENSDYK
ncbi:MAG: hypothetical protein ACRY3E_05260, partial [Candidatus Lariskella arthropodorum]